MQPSRLNAVLTDQHFWVPVVVLILGIALLVAVQ
jgi:hypothetical protein